MKAYLTSIGEKTTGICKWQLERLGFEVIMLDGKESWFDKYKKFIMVAGEDCIRIDADIIPNINLKKVPMSGELMEEYFCYDLYRNNVGVCCPVFYRKRAIEIIRANIDKLDKNRPETSAWRLPEIVKSTFVGQVVMGLHGFFQDKEAVKWHYQHKIMRKQSQEYDFDLINKLWQCNVVSGQTKN